MTRGEFLVLLATCRDMEWDVVDGAIRARDAAFNEHCPITAVAYRHAGVLCDVGDADDLGADALGLDRLTSDQIVRAADALPMVGGGGDLRAELFRVLGLPESEM